MKDILFGAFLDFKRRIKLFLYDVEIFGYEDSS